MSDVIPEGWEWSELGEIGKWSGGGTPSKSNPAYWNHGTIPWVSPKDMRGKWIATSEDYITEHGLKHSTTQQFPQGSILIVFRSGILRHTLPIAITKKSVSINQDMKAIQVDGEFDRDYVYQWMSAHSGNILKQCAKVGTTVESLDWQSIKNFPVASPPKPEQQKIASILTSVDEVIGKTEAQISKLQDLKKGMMQDLLTKGIGHTEFKDSPVGRIPKEWDAVLLDSVSMRGSGHTPSKSYPEYWNGGILWVSLSDSNKLDKLYISKTAKEISQGGLANSSAVLHPEGTVILSRDAGVGKSAILGQEMAVSQHFMAWRCGERLGNHYLYYLLQYWKPKFEGIALGSTIQTIGLPYFKKLQIPLPPVDEQRRIAKALFSTDKRIFALEDKLHQTQSLKKALMQDLLTGTVRVKVN